MREGRQLWTFIVLLAFALTSLGGISPVVDLEVETADDDREDHFVHRRVHKAHATRVRQRRAEDDVRDDPSRFAEPASLSTAAPDARSSVTPRLVPRHAHCPSRIEFARRLSMRSRGPPLRTFV